MRLPVAALLALALSAGAAHAACDLQARTMGAAGAGCGRAWMDENLRVNDLLMVGTHNSYKQAIPPAEFALLTARAPKAAPGLDYAHPGLAIELDLGARQLELDVVYDPEGGRYADPLLPRLAGTPLPPAHLAALAKPGFKVMHAPDFDMRSTCWTFAACLAEVVAWSDAHPDHAPIIILINAKDDAAPGEGVRPLKFDAAAYSALDAEVRAAVPAKKLITPDEVRGGRATLREAVLAGGWPKLGKARGRILLTLDESPKKVALYMGEHTALQGRALFVNTDEPPPASAYLTLNEPVPQAARIAAAVRAGFLVRTRADADTVEARAGTTTRREQALAGGAQYVSTDYLRRDPRWPSYGVALPAGAAALCNPVRTGDRCGGAVVEAQPSSER